jgi:hypothetical protein
MVRSLVPIPLGQSLANHAPQSITAGLLPIWAVITGFQAVPGPAAKTTAKTKKFGAAHHRPEFSLMNWTV